MTTRRAIGAMVALVLTACGGDSAGGGRELPDLTVAPLTPGGPSLDLGELRGPAVVNLWATWCAPCRRELPAFQEVSAARPDVRFIGVDIGEDAAKAQAFIDDLGISFEQFVDQRGELTEALGTAALPVTLIVDAGGTIATEHLGPMTDADLDAAIDDLGDAGG